MVQAQEIDTYRPLLQSIAMNIVKNAQDAEDIIQDVYLKWLTIDRSKVENAKAYLIRTVTNYCLNHINSFKQRKEEYLENFHNSDFAAKWKAVEFPKWDFDWEKELAAANSIMSTKLEPIERTVFVLREAFDFDYESMQEVIHKKKEHCRQILSRAKKKLNSDSPKATKIDSDDTSFSFQELKEAFRTGGFAELVKKVNPEV
ncbi:MAG: sigma-70 family RNA polymerase sigma factor [Cyclobacteriaceae bacterium]|nr:sigma-70 family RNA polymerase sigma factor [Cyclobacteriaceae bacterium]MCH8517332.1 sigma-70 family RNA polymerase sigma factor [Cyclobacteriaceae bacterium]